MSNCTTVYKTNIHSNYRSKCKNMRLSNCITVCNKKHSSELQIQMAYRIRTNTTETRASQLRVSNTKFKTRKETLTQCSASNNSTTDRAIR